jgi:hypothetical protein
MSVIAQRIWREPAVAIGLLFTVALLIVNLAADEGWDAATVVTTLGPLLSALGIRQVVSPAAGPRPDADAQPPPSSP